MTLFVVVQRNKRTGQEYLEMDAHPEGYLEYSTAKYEADQVQEDHDPAVWEVYVGRVVDVRTPVGEPRTLADLS